MKKGTTKGVRHSGAPSKPSGQFRMEHQNGYDYSAIK